MTARLELAASLAVAPSPSEPYSLGAAKEAESRLIEVSRRNSFLV